MADAIGRGSVVSGGNYEGVLRTANEIADVIELMRSGSLAQVILLVDSPAATAVVPLLAKVAGVVCRSGGLTSHLALVSREFGLPCIVGAELNASPAELDGRQVRVAEDGTIWAADA